LPFVDIVGELVCGVVVAMGTDCTVKFQRVSVKPASQHDHISSNMFVTVSEHGWLLL